MKNFIHKIGLEIEGLWYEGHDLLKDDGSVHFDNHECDCNGDYNNCCCYDNCDCDSCIFCQHCGNNTDSCECLECVRCCNCENQLDSCDCDRDIRHLTSCDNENCSDENICDDCIEFCNDEFYDNQDTFRRCDDLDYNCDGDCECECECNEECPHIGEINTDPITEKEVDEFILKNYPDEVNSSCGYHVHLSFKNGFRDIIKLTNPKFHDFLINKLYLWAEKRKINKGSRFYQRLAGVKFAENEFDADGQLSQNNNNRYTHINFNSYHKYETVEFRIGTVFDDKTITMEYTHELIRIVNEWLNQQKEIMNSLLIKKDDIEIEVRTEYIKKGMRIYCKCRGLNNNKKIEKIMINGKTRKYRYFFDDVRLNDKNMKNLIIYDDNKTRFVPNLSFLTLKDIEKGKYIPIEKPITLENYGIFWDKLDNELLGMVELLCV